jgi:Carboxylesterase family
MVTRIPIIRAKEYDASYAKLAERVACNSSSPSVFDCLRTVPVDTFQDVLEERGSGVTSFALKEQPNNVVQDDDFHHARPSEAFKAGKIARVPTIIGASSDRSFLSRQDVD